MTVSIIIYLFIVQIHNNKYLSVLKVAVTVIHMRSPIFSNYNVLCQGRYLTLLK